MSEPEAHQPDPLKHATGYHAPVLSHAVVEELVTNTSGVYVDATLGGGGHSEALLEQLEPDGRVIGIDQDPDALAAAEARLQTAFGNRFTAVRSNFRDLVTVVEQLGLVAVDGILLDLGVSSHQIDTPARGFSYMADGPLDMRMNPDGLLTASDLINTWDARELARVFRTHGQEPRAWRLAQQIVKARPIASTRALADVLERAVPSKDRVKTLARVFQALRIQVNEEMDVLETVLTGALQVLKPGGRIAVISYHSGEDGRVKRFLRFGNFEGQAQRDFFGNLITPWVLLTRKPINADPEEINLNPRARSARLRIAEKRSST
ncbi:MAG: 16S rRNA (cytosine(1402)-N(4))-methyltransferase RsmH [Bacteroidota bacterium]